MWWRIRGLVLFKTMTHNLGAVPELMIIKNAESSVDSTLELVYQTSTMDNRRFILKYKRRK
jgi:hypothetical protein